MGKGLGIILGIGVALGIGYVIYATTRSSAGGGRPAPVSGRGDLDMDGQVSYADRDLLQQYIYGLALLTSEQKRRADANQDGYIDIGDVVAIERYITLGTGIS